MEDRNDIEQMGQIDQAKQALTSLLKLMAEFATSNKKDSNTLLLEKTVLHLEALIKDFEGKTEKISKRSDAFKLAEAQLTNKIANEIASLYKGIKKSSRILRTSKLLSGIGGQRTGNRIAEVIREDLLQKNYLAKTNLKDVTTTVALNSLLETSRERMGSIYEKLYPVSGFLIMTCFVHESSLGQEDKKEIREEYYYVGKVEPHSTPAISVLDYLKTVVEGGMFESIRVMGPVSTISQMVFNGWTLENWGKAVIAGLGQANPIPTNAQILAALDAERHQKETSTAHLFKGKIDPAHIKEVYVVEQKKKIEHAGWRSFNENSYELLKDQLMPDPLTKLYIVVPAENKNLHKSGQNQWKIAFYNEKQAMQFAELAKLHPYWYDEVKGWNLSGWPEKMQKRDFAINTIEAMLGTFLNPHVNINCDAYLHPNKIEKMPIYHELKELSQLVSRLLTSRLQYETTEDMQEALEDIEKTFAKIQDAIDEKNISYGGFGLDSALKICLEAIKEKFSLELKKDEEVSLRH